MKTLRLALLLIALCAPAYGQVTAVISDFGNGSLAHGSKSTIPPTGGASADGYNAVTLALKLPTPEKLAIGNTVFLEADVSTDGGLTWNFVSSMNWTSYGPNGFTAKLPGGRTINNPDPTLGIGVNNLANALYRITYQTNNLTTANPVITGFKN